LVNVLKLTCNDSIKELSFLYNDVGEEVIDSLKQFIIQVNSLDIKLSFFNDNKQDIKDQSDDEIEELVHED
jgi:hypothetical protein